MRISDDRYSRDRLRFDLALRFMRHEARTHTIRKWTGLTDDRIRKLYRSYLVHLPSQVARHRGNPRRQQPPAGMRTGGTGRISASSGGSVAEVESSMDGVSAPGPG